MCVVSVHTHDLRPMISHKLNLYKKRTVYFKQKDTLDVPVILTCLNGVVRLSVN